MNLLVSMPILVLPNFGKDFMICIDASKEGESDHTIWNISKLRIKEFECP
jgi:hypothetical protein